MIRDSLIPALQQRFPDVAFSYFDTPQPFARLSPDCEGIGDLEIYDDGDEATVSIREITHTHFNPYEKMAEHEFDRWIKDAVIDFLEALFADHILLYRTEDRRQGGFQRHDSPIDRSQPVPGTERYQCFVWSGRVATGG